MCGTLHTAGPAGSATVELVANEFVQAVQLESGAGKAMNHVCQILENSAWYFIRLLLLSTSKYILFLLKSCRI